MKKKSISSNGRQWPPAKILFYNFKIHAKSPRGDVKPVISHKDFCFSLITYILMVSCGLCHTKVFFKIKDTLKNQGVPDHYTSIIPRMGDLCSHKSHKKHWFHIRSH